VKRALADAVWMYACVGMGFAIYIALTPFFGGMAMRHGERFMDPRMEFFLFTFTWWKRQGIDGKTSTMLAEWVFIGIVAVIMYLPIRRFRRITGRML